MRHYSELRLPARPDAFPSVEAAPDHIVWERNEGAMKKLNCAVIRSTLLLALVFLSAARLSAHCDTMDGPVVATARVALEKGDVTPVLRLGTDATSAASPRAHGEPEASPAHKH